MVRASARQLTPESGSKGYMRKTKKVVINLHKVRRFLRVGGLIFFLTMANASIQALVAQTQFHLEEVRSELRIVDQRIGWLQCELAAQTTQQQIDRLALGEKHTAHMETKALSSSQFASTLVLPPSILNLDQAHSTPRETVTAKIYHWWSGIGRTLAEGTRHE